MRVRDRSTNDNLSDNFLTDEIPGLPNVWYDPCRDFILVLSILLFDSFVSLNDVLLDFPGLGSQ